MKSLLNTPVHQQVPLSEELTKFLLTLLMFEGRAKDKVYRYGVPLAEQLPELSPKVLDSTEQSMGFQIVVSRLKHHKTQVTPFVLIFLSGICTSPGQCVVWAFAVFAGQRKINKAYGLEDFCFEFPNGLPSEERQREVWDSQKSSASPLGNRLDGGDWEALAKEVEAAETADSKI